MKHLVYTVDFNPKDLVRQVRFLVGMDKHLFVEVITAVGIEFCQYISQLIVLAEGEISQAKKKNC